MTASINWSAAPGYRELDPDSVHLWAISFDHYRSQFGELSAVLSPEESHRASRFHFEKDQIVFVIARGMLRRILSSYLGKQAETIQFIYGKNGKPELACSSDITFNVSHAGDLALYGISRNRSVGVDVEQMRWLPEMDEVARRFFHKEEIECLQRYSGAEKLREFYRLWTRGEALLKWCGEGMTEPEQRLKLTQQFDGRFEELAPAGDYAAALAASGEFKLETWQWADLVPTSEAVIFS
jgi:4'-phosphopantetheinyl transferase